MSAQSPGTQHSFNDKQSSAQSHGAKNSNSESTQHSSGTRKLKRLTRASGDSVIAQKAAERTSRKSDSRIQITRPQDLIGIALANDRYRVKSQLGKGSMAYVFLAEDRRLETDVVIKVPKPELFTTRDFRERFKRESQLLVRFSHPHVVGVLDVGECDGLPYVVMPLLSGGSLLDRMKRDRNDKGQMTPESLKDWVPAVARALDFCCRKGMVHRDVKPANILFDGDNNAFVGDFGLSKVMYGEHTELNSSETMAGIVLGTPNYVSPEVIHGKPYDGRADQYSLGITVYQMLFGRAPMQGSSPTATMINQTQRKLQLLSDIRPDVSRELAVAIQKSIEKDPERRFACCEDFAEAVLEGLRVPVNAAVHAQNTNEVLNQEKPESIGIVAEPAADNTAQPEPSAIDMDWLKTLDAAVSPSARVLKSGVKTVESAAPRTAGIRKPKSQRPSTTTVAKQSRLAITIKQRLVQLQTSLRLRRSQGAVAGVVAGAFMAVLLVGAVCWAVGLFAGSPGDSISRAPQTSPQSTPAATVDSSSENTNTTATAATASPFEATDAMLLEMKKNQKKTMWEWDSRPSDSATESTSK